MALSIGWLLAAALRSALCSTSRSYETMPVAISYLDLGSENAKGLIGATYSASVMQTSFFFDSRSVKEAVFKDLFVMNLGAFLLTKASMRGAASTPNDEANRTHTPVASPSKPTKIDLLRRRQVFFIHGRLNKGQFRLWTRFPDHPLNPGFSETTSVAFDSKLYHSPNDPLRLVAIKAFQWGNVLRSIDDHFADKALGAKDLAAAIFSHYPFMTVSLLRTCNEAKLKPLKMAALRPSADATDYLYLIYLTGDEYHKAEFFLDLGIDDASKNPLWNADFQVNYEYMLPYSLISRTFATEPRTGQELISILRDQHWSDAAMGVVAQQLFTLNEHPASQRKRLVDCIKMGRSDSLRFMIEFVKALVRAASTNEGSSAEQRQNFAETLQALNDIARHPK